MPDTKPAQTEEAEASSGSQLASLMKDDEYFFIPEVGDVVKGTIISVQKNEVKIDIDGVSTGVVRGRELFNESEEYGSLKVGDEVESTVVEQENENGELELSFRVAGNQRAWGALTDLRDEGSIIKAKIVDANKGGLMIRLQGISGFLPVSQLSTEHYPRVPGGDKIKILERLKKYVGEEFEAKVLDADMDDEKLIISEKAAWEESQSGIISALKIGDVVDGKVAAVTDFGAFVEFGDNLEGLVHISEIAWQRIDRPEDFVKVGDEVKAKIINIEGSKIFLSMKALLRDPWDDVDERYRLGQKVSGKVLKVNPFGLFVELDKEIHGLAHVSELSEKKNIDPTEIASPGATMDFVIVSIEKRNHRLGLSLKRKPFEPAAAAPAPSTDSPRVELGVETGPDGKEEEKEEKEEEASAEAATEKEIKKETKEEEPAPSTGSPRVELGVETGPDGKEAPAQKTEDEASSSAPADDAATEEKKAAE